jgi:hypothetical protein
VGEAEGRQECSSLKKEPKNFCSFIPTRIETDAPAKQGSISFLKKRNKKLLLRRLTRRIRLVRTAASKSFWFFFSKKNCFLGALPS